jgi:lactose/L-arabinose transport system substrate-binding protein
MKGTKKLLALLMAMMMVVSTAACSAPGTDTTNPVAEGDKTATGEKKVVNVWAWDVEFNIPVMNEAKARYEAKHPDVTINVQEYSYDDVVQKLNTNLTSGVNDGLPEIVLCEDPNIQKNLTSYPGAFYDLTGKIDFSKFASYKVKTLTMDDKVYGVPFDMGTEGLFYRTDYLEQAGYTADDLKNITWSQFIEIGKKVKEKTGKAMLTLDPNSVNIIRDIMWSTGTWYFDENGNTNIANNPSIIEGAKVYKSLMDSGIVKLTTGWGEMVAALNNGDVASITTGCWIIPSIKAEPTQSGKWAVTHMPRLEVEGGTNYGNRGGSSWLVLNNAPNADVAADFLNETFGSDADLYQTILSSVGAIGTYLPAASGEEYNKGQEFFGGQKIFSDFSEWAQNVPSINFGIYSDEADSYLITGMNEIINNGADINATLKSVEDQLKQQMQ